MQSESSLFPQIELPIAGVGSLSQTVHGRHWQYHCEDPVINKLNDVLGLYQIALNFPAYRQQRPGHRWSPRPAFGG